MMIRPLERKVATMTMCAARFSKAKQGLQNCIHHLSISPFCAKFPFKLWKSVAAVSFTRSGNLTMWHLKDKIIDD